MPWLSVTRIACVCILWCIGLPFSPLYSQTVQYELRTLDRIGAARGESVVLQTNAPGKDLQFSHPSIVATPEPNDPNNAVEGKTFRVQVAREAPLGFLQAQLTGLGGISNTRRFLITDRPWSMASNNETPATPMAFPVGTFVQDECPANGKNYYRFTVNQPVSIRISTYALSLDSRARLVLSLKENARKTLATSTSSLERDAMLQFDCEPNKEYQIVVSDHIYRGGPEYRYAMSVLSAQDAAAYGEPNELLSTLVQRWESAASDLLGRTDLRPYNNRLLHPRTAFLRKPTTGLEEKVYDEQKESDMPLVLSGPSRIIGQWETNDDIDRVEFRSEANEVWALEVVSQRLGETTDSLVSIDRVDVAADGKRTFHRLAEWDDGPNPGNAEMVFGIKDTIALWTAPAASLYRINIKDLQRSSRMPTPSYALEVRRPNPGFSAGVAWVSPVRDLANTRPATGNLGVAAPLFCVYVARWDGFSAPLQARLEGLDPALVSEPVRIAPNQSFAWGTIHPISDSGIRDVELSAIVSSVDDPSQTWRAIPLALVWESNELFKMPIARREERLSLGVRPNSPMGLQVALGPVDRPSESPVVIARTTKNNLLVRWTRGAQANAKGTVRLRGLPPGITANEPVIEANQNEGNVELNVSADAPLGEYTVHALVEMQITVPADSPFQENRGKNTTIQYSSSSVRIRVGEKP